MLSKDELIAKIRGPIKLIDVPEWGGQVSLRKLSATDLMRIRELVKTHNEQKANSNDAQKAESDLNLTTEFLAMVLCDELGQRILTAPELREWDTTQQDLMQRLVAAGREYNGLDEGAAEDREKNSESGQTSEPI